MAKRPAPAPYLGVGAPRAGTRLCAIDEISDPGAKGFVFGSGVERFEMFVVREGARVFAYVNACPHQLNPLETFPNQFLDRETGFIVCSTHGARFRTEDGMCVSGPCEGRALTAISICVKEGSVYVAD